MVQSQVVLVGGGTGFVGRHLVNLLKRDGAKVRVITRKPGTSADHISWDTIKSKGLPSDTTAVVNLAGRNILDPVLWTENFKREVYSSRVETNKLLAEAINAATNKPKAFVTVSGVGYYPSSDPVTEFDEEWRQERAAPGEASVNDLDFLAKLARDWEKAGELEATTGSPSSEQAQAHATTTRRVIIRSGVVIGPDGGIVKNLMLPFKLGLGGPIGDGKQWMPWIHVDDLANMFKFSILNEHVEGVLNGVAPEQVSNRQFSEEFASSLSRPAFLPLPGFAVNLLFGSERGTILLRGQRVKSRASLLGFRYQYPSLQSAIAASTS